MFKNFRIVAFAVLLGSLFTFSSCEENKEDEPMLHVAVRFDANQERLDNFGNPSTIPAGNAAQTPDFKELGIHSLELLPGVFTLPGEGESIFEGALVSTGSGDAIDFDRQLITTGGGEIVYSIPLSEIEPGTYPYTRSSIGYQKYDVDFQVTDTTFGTFQGVGRIASFLGFNTYITSYTIENEVVEVNDAKTQGYWGFEWSVAGLNDVVTGEAPATTVVNPLAATSPIPAGSCLVTGVFDEALEITGSETEDITIELSVSINNSFEWTDSVADGLWEPTAGEGVVDMGLRGIQVSVR